MENRTMTRHYSHLQRPSGRIHRAAVVVALLGSACSFGDTLEPYYSGGGPELSSLSVSEEQGNVGGQTTTISGSGFGEDLTLITVVFGSQNANILSVSDSSIDVLVPRGPVEGGWVDVTVGTADGQDRAEDVYHYDTRLGAEVDIFENQVAYISITNDYFSCGGGIGNVLTNPSLMAAYGWTEADIEGGIAGWEGPEDPKFSPWETFCNEGLTFGGYVGIDGRSELLEFPYPRLHTLYAGYRNGFGGNVDLSPGEWSVQVPPQEVIGVDLEGFYDDQRYEIDDFVVTNVDVREAVSGEDRAWCADLSALTDVGWDATGSSDEDGCEYRDFSTNAPFYKELEDCSGSNGKQYDLSEMQFCQADDYENTRSYRYEAEWPVGDYFFKGADSNGDLALMSPVTIQLDVPEAGIEGVQVVLPEAAVFRGEVGWNVDAFGTALQGALKGAYGLVGFSDTCADSDGDGESTAEDIAATVSWMPSEAKISTGDGVVGGRTYVRFSIQAAGFGWYGGEGAIMKATITVDDEYNVDEETGESTLAIPASVLYQVPTMLQDFGGFSSDGEESTTDECGEFIPDADIQFEWADPDVVNYGFVITQAERITEYAIEAEALRPEGAAASAPTPTLGFAYSTGDIGYTIFGTASDGSPSWLNPADGQTSCGDCADNDGDGWSDVNDPDCTVTDVDGDGISDADSSQLSEDNARFGLTSCNDLVDNDDDGDIDSEDDDCNRATDEESNCSDREDNDGDGWEDRDDIDCQEGGIGYEDGFSEFECNDDIDNDGDGAIDTEESECRRPTDRETNCNDGIDNDEDSLIDDADPECVDEFDGVENVRNSTDTTCNDGVDNDGDGWFDLEDPDCPTLLGEEIGLGTTECNDGIDNDLHGDIDRDDPTCERIGALGDESPAFSAGCADSSDNDSDGYTDGNDPDCEYAPFSLERLPYHEPGLYPGVPACYNGVDDDGNGDTDAADPDCVNFDGAPSGFVQAEDPAAPGCTNGVDDDEDSWVDFDDPDCDGGIEEVGFGGTECNDGVDNDDDTLIDAEDPDCSDADDFESDASP
jgi:hypothetical protein